MNPKFSSLFKNPPKHNKKTLLVDHISSINLKCLYSFQIFFLKSYFNSTSSYTNSRLSWSPPDLFNIKTFFLKKIVCLFCLGIYFYRFLPTSHLKVMFDAKEIELYLWCCIFRYAEIQSPQLLLPLTCRSISKAHWYPIPE